MWQLYFVLFSLNEIKTFIRISQLDVFQENGNLKFIVVKNAEGITPEAPHLANFE